MTPIPAAEFRDRVIVALDTRTGPDALALADRISAEARFCKIGIGHLGWDAVQLARTLRQRGFRVFLDLKLFDIGSVVARAVSGIIERAEPDFLTVHGDPQVVAAAVRAREGANTRILAVTLLTSLSSFDLEEMMIRPGKLTDIVRERGRRALEAGADGLIAAPTDIPALRTLRTCRDRLIVSPGIRINCEPHDDQSRTASPQSAFRAGANFIVIGRPIISAADPCAAIREILSCCAE